MKFNDLDIKKWKESDINVDSLWLINERDKRGKHSNKYHGNFIPQIPYQLIKRYTKKQDIVLDMFLGSGTTLFECENLKRNFIGFDINEDIITFVKNKMEHSNKINFKVKLKGIVVKNIEGNKGKLGKGGIWKYRALNSDYYIFKHEYILVFKKEF